MNETTTSGVLAPFRALLAGRDLVTVVGILPGVRGIAAGPHGPALEPTPDRAVIIDHRSGSIGIVLLSSLRVTDDPPIEVKL